MKAEELMIGDWVIVHGPVEQKFKRKIDIGDLSFFVEFDPIPLTPKLLEKNGWIDKDFMMVLKSEPRLGWYKTSHQIIIDYHTFVIKVDYVHQLQHLMKMVGIEKEIEL